MSWVLGLFSFPLYLYSTLTYWEDMPRDSRCGKAREHIVCAAEVGDVGTGNRLTSTLTPHQNLPALGLGSWRVAGVTRSHLHHPSGNERIQTSKCC